MKSVIIAWLTFGLLTYSHAQTVATDHANAGQLKRMAFERWDDWSPDPSTNWIGWPNNLLGYMFWQWIYSNYYRGPDRRPYRVGGGPFETNLGSLGIQNIDEKRIADSTSAINKTNLATIANMTGGILDTPYDLFFKSKFQKLTTIEQNNISILATKNPKAYLKLIASKVFTDYMENLDIQSSRIEVTHNSFVDKGERILIYLDIKKQLEFSNRVLEHYINTYLNFTKLPEPNELPPLSESSKKLFNNDAKIVKNILQNFKY